MARNHKCDYLALTMSSIWKWNMTKEDWGYHEGNHEEVGSNQALEENQGPKEVQRSRVCR